MRCGEGMEGGGRWMPEDCKTMGLGLGKQVWIWILSIGFGVAEVA